MANPLLNQTQANFGVQNSNLNQIKQMYDLFKISKNPSQLIMNNPKIAEVIKMCNGQNPKDVFYALCKERNIDPNSILNRLR